MTNDRITFWQEFTPIWMFRCRPEEFRSTGFSICPGVFWLHGLISLVIFHGIFFAAFLNAWYSQGYNHWMLVSLIPVAALWAVFCSADIRYRRQHPTKEERSGFDDAVLNWFGFVTFAVSTVAFLPATILYFLWQSFF